MLRGFLAARRSALDTKAKGTVACTSYGARSVAERTTRFRLLSVAVRGADSSHELAPGVRAVAGWDCTVTAITPTASAVETWTSTTPTQKRPAPMSTVGKRMLDLINSSDRGGGNK
jgi:hypothetical protein